MVMEKVRAEVKNNGTRENRIGDQKLYKKWRDEFPKSSISDIGSSSDEKKMLSEQAKEYLKAWMLSPEHCDHPYPTADEKAVIMADTGISFPELNN